MLVICLLFSMQKDALPYKISGESHIAIAISQKN